MNKYVLFCGCILALSSCGEKQLGPVAPDGPRQQIAFSTGVAGTKALLGDQTAFDDPATVIKVYDFVSGTDASGVAADGKYIDDSIHGTIAADGTWAYNADDTHYYWTHTGIHRFFGWLTASPDGTAFEVTPVFEDGSKKLSVPDLQLGMGSDQFDFLYSDIVSRNAADASQHGKVELNMQHLFSAFAFTIDNDSPKPVVVREVSIKGLKDKQGADISFAADASTVSYLRKTHVADIGKTYTGNLSVASKTARNLLTGETLELQDDEVIFPDSGYRLMWPQDETDFENAHLDVTYTASVFELLYQPRSTTRGDYVVDIATEVGAGKGSYNRYVSNGIVRYVPQPDGNGSYNVSFRSYNPETDAGVYRYDQQDKPTEFIRDVSRSLTLHNIAGITQWEPGVKYRYDLVFSSVEITLKLVVMNWDGDHVSEVTFE